MGSARAGGQPNPAWNSLPPGMQRFWLASTSADRRDFATASSSRHFELVFV